MEKLAFSLLLTFTHDVVPACSHGPGGGVRPTLGTQGIPPGSKKS
jgi:hypothetical protein